MDKTLIFIFKTDISELYIPSELNNPFRVDISEIADLAAKEFQDFLTLESKKWKYDFHTQRGKMFGVLVVEKENHSYGYLGTISGKLPKNDTCEHFTPSVFDDSIDDYYINRGMAELTKIGQQINEAHKPSDVNILKEKRKQKSVALQEWLFENYSFSNLSGKECSLLDIFEQSTHGKPPAAAGECAAPKLFHYAISHGLKPIALAEFWWGKSDKEMEHLAYYPSCKNRCRPILEYMLEDSGLYDRRG